MATNVYKTITFTISNNSKGVAKLTDARREINRIQRDTNLEIFNLLLSWAGIFNVALGITSAVFGGITTSYASYLESWEDLYTHIIEDFAKFPSSESGNISYVKISYDLIGTKDRCKASKGRYTYHKN